MIKDERFFVNYGYDEELNYNVPFVKAEILPKIKVLDTRLITEDLFATGAKNLVNGKSTILQWFHMVTIITDSMIPIHLLELRDKITI